MTRVSVAFAMFALHTLIQEVQFRASAGPLACSCRKILLLIKSHYTLHAHRFSPVITRKTQWKNINISKPVHAGLCPISQYMSQEYFIVQNCHIHIFPFQFLCVYAQIPFSPTITTPQMRKHDNAGMANSLKLVA